MTDRDSPDTPLSIETMMQRALDEPGMLSLAAGFTDNSILPRDAVQSLTREILSSPEVGGEALQYGDPRGRVELRRAVAERVRSLDENLGGDVGTVEADHVVVTNGSQQGLELAVRALCDPGDAVLVESPTYFVFLDLLRVLGVEPVSLPSRDGRLQLDALPAFFARLKSEGIADRLGAAYVMGYFANPTGYCQTRRAKRKLVEALEGAGLRVPLIEDAAYREFHFGDPWPAESYLCLGGDSPVVYAGTFTKTFATGMKVGYLVVPQGDLRRRIRDLKRVSDFGTSSFIQVLLERALETGVYDRYLERMRPHYAAKAQILHDALVESGLRDLGWRWERARGGLYLWVTAPEGVDVGPDSTFYRACMAEKVMYVPGSLCYAGGGDGRGRIRLSYGNLDRDLLGEAARRLVRAARAPAPEGIPA